MKILRNVFNISFFRDKLLQSLEVAIGNSDSEKAKKCILKLADYNDPDALRWVFLQLDVAEKQNPVFAHDLYKQLDASSHDNASLKHHVFSYYEEYLCAKMQGKPHRATIDLLKGELRSTEANTVMRKHALDSMEHYLPFIERSTGSDVVLGKFLDGLIGYSAPDTAQRQRFVEKKNALVAAIRKQDPEVAQLLAGERRNADVIPFRPYTPEEREAMFRLGAPPKSGLSVNRQPH